jgi:hypothetical protein
VSFGGAVKQYVSSLVTLTIQNNGGTTLNLGAVTITGANANQFQVVSAPAYVLPAGSASLVIRMLTDTTGSKTAFVSIANSDGNENPYDFKVSGTVIVAPTEMIIDDASSNTGGFTKVGTWTGVSGSGYSSDYRTNAAGTGDDKAEWLFTGLAAGTYEVYATWVGSSGRATNAPYSIFDSADGIGLLGTYAANQSIAPPANLVADGRNWAKLGTFTIADHDLLVRLIDIANGTVVADGVRVRRIG